MRDHVTVVSYMNSLGLSLVPNHLPYLIHLPCVQVRSDPQPKAPPPWKPKTLKRIIDPANYFYDSDSSDEENPKQDAKEDDKKAAEKSPEVKSDPHGKLMCSSLKALSRLHDTLSFSDCFQTFRNEKMEGSCKSNTLNSYSPAVLSAGLLDEQAMEQHNVQNGYDILSYIEVGAIDRLNSELDSLNQEVSRLSCDDMKDVRNRISLPVYSEKVNQVSVTDENSLQLR